VTELNTIDPPITHDARELCVEGSYLQDDGNETPIREAADKRNTPEGNAADVSHQESIELLGRLPPEIGMLLIISGIAGVLLPGPVGTPLLIAGGVTLWPKTFEPIERWFSQRFPSVHQEGVFQIKEFISDLQKRFPDKS
jgi:hypothetical protein